MEQIESFKFLVVHITKELSWSTHTNTVVFAINTASIHHHGLYKVSKAFPREAMQLCQIGLMSLGGEPFLFFYFFYLILPRFRGIQLFFSSYYLVSLPYGLGRDEG